jgi:hypothetical protein
MTQLVRPRLGQSSLGRVVDATEAAAGTSTGRHGDWITIGVDGSCIVSGRSDATLNRVACA